MDVTGIIKVKFDTVVVSDKFKKREFVVTLDHTSQYPQQVAFQLTQDKVSIVDQYNVGDEVKVHFNLRGREWKNPQGETKYFNTIDAWRIERVGAGSQSAAPSNNTASSNVAPDFSSSSSDNDDLPF